jgi:hypothetical protein
MTTSVDRTDPDGTAITTADPVTTVASVGLATMAEVTMAEVTMAEAAAAVTAKNCQRR